MRRTVLTLCVLLLSTGASAQVYKVVGADGKVTYTDRPPVDPGARTTLFRAGVAKPASPAPGAAGPAATVRPEGPAGAGAPEQPNPTPSELLRPIRTVLGRRVLVDRTMEMCGRMLPDGRGRYAQLQQDWHARNRELLAQLDGVLAREIPADIREGHEKWVDGMVRLQLGFAARMTPAGRHDWCEEQAGMIGGTAVNSPDLPGSAVLLGYRLGK